jgi:hypothetical protein
VLHNRILTVCLVSGLFWVACGGRPSPPEAVPSAGGPDVNLYRVVAPGRIGAKPPMVRLTPGLGVDQNGVIAPDGNWFAWVSDQDGAAKLWIARKDGTGARALAPAPIELIPVWSPDAKWISIGERAVSTATAEVRPARPNEFSPRIPAERIATRTGVYFIDWAGRTIQKEETEFKRTVEMFRLPDTLEAAPPGTLMFDVSPDETWFLMRITER